MMYELDVFLGYRDPEFELTLDPRGRLTESDEELSGVRTITTPTPPELPAWQQLLALLSKWFIPLGR